MSLFGRALFGQRAAAEQRATMPVTAVDLAEMLADRTTATGRRVAPETALAQSDGDGVRAADRRIGAR